MKATPIAAAIAALTLAGAAFAQSNPPNASVKDPATGAGQQNTQNAPMGTTGTLGAGKATSDMTSTTGSSTMGASTTPSASTDTAASTTDMGMTPADKSTKSKKDSAPRADRN